MCSARMEPLHPVRRWATRPNTSRCGSPAGVQTSTRSRCASTSAQSATSTPCRKGCVRARGPTGITTSGRTPGDVAAAYLNRGLPFKSWRRVIVGWCGCDRSAGARAYLGARPWGRRRDGRWVDPRGATPAARSLVDRRPWTAPTARGLQRRGPGSPRTGDSGTPSRPLTIGSASRRPARDVPPPLVQQLAARGRLIAPVLEGGRQRLTLLEQTVDGVRRWILADVLYVSLRGTYGVGSDAQN